MPDVNILLSASDKTGPAFKSAESNVKNLSSQAQSAGSSLSAMGVAIGTTFGNLAATGITTLIGKMTDLVGSTVSTGIGFNAMWQQSSLAFETMLGNGKLAESFLQKLQAFAAKTPFEFPELVTASQRMLAMGFESKEVLPTLTAIGDAVAGLGGNSAMVDRVTTALGQMQAKGKATGEEMMQLTESGIPAWEFLAKKIGVSIPEAMDMVSKGAVSADVAIGALVDGMNTKFGGLMDAQSKTFGGLLSTIKDTFSQVSGTVMQPLFEQMTRGLQMIVDWTNSPAFAGGVKFFTGVMEQAAFAASVFFDSIEEGRSFMDALANAISVLIPPSIFDIWVRFNDIVRGVFASVQLLITGDFRGGLFGLNEDHPFVAALLMGRDAAKWLYEQVVKLIGKTSEWLTNVLTPLGGTLGDVIQWIDRFGGQIRDALKPIGDAISKFLKFEDVLNAAGAVLLWMAATAIPPLIGGLLSFAAPIAAVVAAVAAMRLAWQNDFASIRTLTQQALKSITTWFYQESGLWHGSWEETFEYFAWWVKGGWKNDIYFPIRSTLISLGNDFESWRKGVIATIRDWAGEAKERFDTAWGLLKHIVTSWVSDVRSEIVHWVDGVVDKIDFWQRRAETIFMVWKNNTVQYFKDFDNNTVATLTSWGESIGNLFRTALANIKETEWYKKGENIIEGFREGVTVAWYKFLGFFEPEYGRLARQLEKEYEMNSPSKRMYRYGQWIMEGLGQGLKAYSSVPLSYMESMSSSLTSQMERLKGAVVQSAADINNLIRQTNPNNLPVIGVIPGTNGGTAFLGGGINKLPNGGKGTATAGSQPSNIGNFVPLQTEITTLGQALGTNTSTAQAMAQSVSLLGGISLQAVDLAQAKDSLAKTSEASAKTLADFVAGMGDFVKDTLADANNVFRYFNQQENKAYAEGTLKEFINSEAANTKKQLQNIYQGLQNSFADILGISTNELNVTGTDSLRLADRMKQLLSGTNAMTNMEHLSALLQEAVNFRNLSNFGTGREYYANVLPTDSRLTGNNTTNEFNITLQGSSNASADVLGLVELLGSLQGSVAP